MTSSPLFQPLKIGGVQLKHRVVMAPLTRLRADKDLVPLPFVKEYYGQRASTPGTLLITECTAPSLRSSGFPNMPGIWSTAHIAAWKEITGEVHKHGSFIYLQVGGFGRAVQPEFAKVYGIETIAPSAIQLEGHPSPREMTEADIEDSIKDFVQAAQNAIEAGFDGVEIHGANGYLINQFISSRTNQRTDQYGGNIQNRSRYLVDVVRAVSKVIGAGRVGIRLSPWSAFQDVLMDDPIPQYTHLLEGLRTFKPAYLHLVEARISGAQDSQSTESLQFALDAWQKASPVLIAGGFSPDTARAALNGQYKDEDAAIVFGRHFISNPDLPFRIQRGLQLGSYDRNTFYTPGSRVGYTDYTFSEEFKKDILVGA